MQAAEQLRVKSPSEKARHYRKKTLSKLEHSMASKDPKVKLPHKTLLLIPVNEQLQG